MINTIITEYQQRQNDTSINKTQRKLEDAPFKRPTTPSMSVSYVQQF